MNHDQRLWVLAGTNGMDGWTAGIREFDVTTESFIFVGGLPDNARTATGIVFNY